MILDFLGIIGLGMVWGWYLGMVLEKVHQPLNTITALLMATLAVSLFILWHSGVSGLALLTISALSVLLVNLLWHRELQRHYGAFPPLKFEVE